MGASSATTLAIAALALLWLGVAAAIALVAARRFRLAQQVLAAAQSNARLLELMPARPMVVRPDQRIEADERLVRDLGLKASPTTLSNLTSNDSGIAPEDLEALTRDIAVAQASAEQLSRTVRVHGSSRVFEVRGGPAASGEAPGTLLLWFTDISVSEEERVRSPCACVRPRVRSTR